MEDHDTRIERVQFVGGFLMVGAMVLFLAGLAGLIFGWAGVLLILIGGITLLAAYFWAEIKQIIDMFREGNKT